MHDDTIDQGCFYVPHKVFDPKAGLTRNQKIFFIALLALEDTFLMRNKPMKLRQWFNIGNKDLCKMIGFSEGKLKSARDGLLQKRLIDFKPGFHS